MNISSFGDVVDYVNNKDNEEDFIINIYLDGSEVNNSETNGYGGSQGGKREDFFI